MHLLIIGTSVLLTAIVAADKTIPFFPLYYKYGGYPKIMSDVIYGAPGQQSKVPTVIDLGSADFWVYGPNAIVDYGSQYLGQLGPCNITAKPNFNYKASKTASKKMPEHRAYSYGGNGKIISSSFSINDTIRFTGRNVPAFSNTNVAISNFALLRIPASECSGADTFDYDKSILGLSRFKNPSFKTVGPSFRNNLLTSGAIGSSTLSMWFDTPPAKANGTFRGTALFGAVATDKYDGPLVRVKASPPNGAYVGYYIPNPVISVSSVKNPKKSTKLGTGKNERCYVDSGFGTEHVPVDQDKFLAASGLVLHGGYPAFNGTCDGIPKDARITFTFPGITKGKSVDIKVPLRNFARGLTDYLGHKKCGLSMELGSDCILGAPSITAMFFAVNDDENEIAIAQAGVSKGALNGKKGLGDVKVVKKGQSIPGAI